MRRYLIDFGGHIAALARLAPFAVAPFHVEALVVIGRGTPEVRDTAVLDNGIAIENVAGKRTRLLVESNLEVGTFDGEAADTGNLLGAQSADIHFGRPGLVIVDAELFMSDTVARLRPEFILLEAEIDIQMVFRTDCRLDVRQLDGNFLLLEGPDVQLRAAQLAVLDNLAVFPELPDTFEEVAEVLEQVAVLDFDFALRGVDVLHAQLAILILDFPHFRLNRTVGEHEAVRAEVVIVLPVAPHATEFPVRSALVVQALVNEIPDKATEGARVAIEGIHVFLQIAHGVAHGVFVFAEHHRLVRILVTGDIVVAPVHLARHVGIVVIAFVVHVAGGVDFVRALAFRGKHVAVAGFVTERPQDDTRVVLVALHHAVQAVHHRSAPVIAALGQVAVRTVAFHVRLVNHVNTVLVAKIVHYRVVRVVRHAESIDIELLHQDDILFHAVVSHCAAIIRVELVAVHAVELDRHAVHQQARGSVVLLDFDRAETNLVTFDLDDLARVILDGEHRRVEVRRFCRPAIRLGIRDFEMHALFATVRADTRDLLRRRGNHFAAGVVVERKFHRIFARR